MMTSFLYYTGILFVDFVFVASNDRAAFDIAIDVNIGCIASGLSSFSLTHNTTKKFPHIDLDEAIIILDRVLFKAIVFELEQVKTSLLIALVIVGSCNHLKFHPFFIMSYLSRF